MKEILRWIHAENERLGIDPLTRSVTLFPIMSRNLRSYRSAKLPA